ncbi:unnamed protein product [marine sediment metagenome]|uniref:Uncharacterized protein n=1 Tax=marine sediment metagenome TaxID=412755 RepID=X0WT96_9ZZZZ
MWVHDYRPDIRAVVGEVEVPPVQTIIVGVLFFGVTIGVVLYSNARLRQQNRGKLSFLAAFTNSALLLFFFAVRDLLILDWLIFVTIQLSNLAPPIVYLTAKAIQMICFGHSLPLQENSL